MVLICASECLVQRMVDSSIYLVFSVKCYPEIFEMT